MTPSPVAYGVMSYHHRQDIEPDGQVLWKIVVCVGMRTNLRGDFWHDKYYCKYSSAEFFIGEV